MFADEGALACDRGSALWEWLLTASMRGLHTPFADGGTRYRSNEAQQGVFDIFDLFLQSVGLSTCFVDKTALRENPCPV